MNDTTNSNPDSASGGASSVSYIPLKGWEEDTARAAVRKQVLDASIPDAERAARIEAARDAAVNFFGAVVTNNLREDVNTDGYVDAIVPASKHDADLKRHVVESVAIVRLPSIPLLDQSTAGQGFMTDAIYDRLIGIVKAGMNQSGTILPLRVPEFTAGRGKENEAWRELRKDFLDALHAKSPKLKGKLDLRAFEMCLRSQAYAEATGWQRIAPELWESIIKAMIQAGQKRGYVTIGLENWMETRRVMDLDYGDLDVSGLGALLGDGDDEGDDADEDDGQNETGDES